MPNNKDTTTFKDRLKEIQRLVFEAGFLDGSKPEDYRERLPKVMQIGESVEAILASIDEVMPSGDVEGWMELADRPTDYIIGYETAINDVRSKFGISERKTK